MGGRLAGIAWNRVTDIWFALRLVISRLLRPVPMAVFARHSAHVSGYIFLGPSSRPRDQLE